MKSNGGYARNVASRTCATGECGVLEVFRKVSSHILVVKFADKFDVNEA